MALTHRYEAPDKQRKDYTVIEFNAIWEVPRFRRDPGQPSTKWRRTVKKNLYGLGHIWEKAVKNGIRAWTWPNVSTRMPTKSRSRSR